MPALFRTSAIRAAEYRWFSPVQIVTPPSAPIALTLAILAIGGLLLALIAIEIPERVRASGVLMPSQGLLKVRSRRSGWVDRLSVSEGANVVRGQTLLWLTDTQSAPDRGPETVTRIESLQNELLLAEQSVEQEIAGIEARRQYRHRRTKLLGSQLAAARSEHLVRRSQSSLQNDRASRIALLVAEGLLAEQSADDATIAALQAEATSQAAWQQVLALQDNLLLLERQSLEDAESPALLRMKARREREATLREIAESELRSATTVTAQINGLATGLSVRPGSYVQAGQVIVTLYDPADRLEAHLYVSADNAAMIKVGQRVELQLRAYPHQLFGTQAAVISSISAAARSDRENDLPVPVHGPVFELRARLESATVSARGVDWPLPPGTMFTADIVRRRWPLYVWLLRPAVGPTAGV